MELEEMQRRWQEMDRKLDASLRLNERVLAQAVLSRAQRKSRWTGRGLVLEIVLGVLPVLWLGSFLADHIREPRFWIPALLLDVFAIASFGALLRQRLLLGSIDWSGPVAEIQRALAELRVRRARTTMGTLVVSPLLWTPLLVVALEGFVGVDAYRVFNAAWFAGNVLFGIAVLVLALWVARRFSERLEGAPLLRRLLRDLGGRSLGEAERAVASIDRFEDRGPR
jgi:hypothetical protein